MNKLNILFIIIFSIISIWWLVFVINQCYDIYKIKKNIKLQTEYSKLTNIIFDFYRKDYNFLTYKNNYDKFIIIINKHIGSIDLYNHYIEDIIELKELHKDIIPEIKKEYRKDKLKRALKF